MQKKEYLVPTLEVVDIEYEGVLALSVDKGPSESENEEPIGTKKNDGSFNHTWE